MSPTVPGKKPARKPAAATADAAPARKARAKPAFPTKEAIAEPAPVDRPGPPPGPASQAPEPPQSPVLPRPDFDALSKNMVRLVEEGGKALAAYAKPLEEGRTNPDFSEQVGDAVKTLGHVAEYWMADPTRAMTAQTALASSMLTLWSNTLKRYAGETPAPVVPPDPKDKRFADPQWRESPIFDFLRQAYAISTNWATHMVQDAQGIDPLTREKAQFYVNQIAGALAPSNFVATNPELIRKTLAENGENLVRGMHMLSEDVEAGHGQLKIRQSDSSRFEYGVDVAATPGKVIFRNDLIELIQYAPTTPTVYKRPLLIVPPWINKFYILDLNPEKSFVRWAVSEGLTVFLISWVNPDERQADKSFEAYMREGILAALDAIEQATGEKQVTSIGYCVGGTLTAVTLAWMAAKGDNRIASTTFFAAQVDFTDPGDLKLFIDEERLRSLQEKMSAKGYLEGTQMASAFNMLRPNDLIWSYYVNNYMKGKTPAPFDLLTWNSDSTRMPAANHAFYLRNCYLDNNLTQGRMEVGGETLDLRKVTIPIYNLAAREDHIAPARSVFTGAKYFGGPVRYVLAGSGHIAGVINPAGKPKYQYWTGPAPEGAYDDWIAAATEHKGSWWVDWIEWIRAQAPEKVPARTPGDGKLKPICDAPGEYVRVKA